MEQNEEMKTSNEEVKETTVEEWDVDWDWKVTVEDLKSLIDELSKWWDLSAKDFDDLRDYINSVDHADVQSLTDPEEPMPSKWIPEATTDAPFNLF